MRNGSCKYGANCKFNHPDPTAAGACDSPCYGNGGSVTSQVASQVGVASWLSPGTMNEAATYVPIMFPPPPQGVPSQNPGWNGFQVLIFPLCCLTFSYFWLLMLSLSSSKDHVKQS